MCKWIGVIPPVWTATPTDRPNVVFPSAAQCMRENMYCGMVQDKGQKFVFRAPAFKSR